MATIRQNNCQQKKIASIVKFNNEKNSGENIIKHLDLEFEQKKRDFASQKSYINIMYEIPVQTAHTHDYQLDNNLI